MCGGQRGCNNSPNPDQVTAATRIASDLAILVPSVWAAGRDFLAMLGARRPEDGKVGGKENGWTRTGQKPEVVCVLNG